MPIVYNALQTPDGTVIESHNANERVSHVDRITGKTYFVEGGYDYAMISINGDEKYLHLFTDDYDLADHLIWKNGKLFKNLTDDEVMYYLTDDSNLHKNLVDLLMIERLRRENIKKYKQSMLEIKVYKHR